LGSYWKGRKPLVLVTACILGSLLPATGDDERDLEILELLLGVADEQTEDRMKGPLSAHDILRFGTHDQIEGLLEDVSIDGISTTRVRETSRSARRRLMADVLAQVPYDTRISYLRRPEDVARTGLTEKQLGRINAHLGTSAASLGEVVEQLGIMRFGHRARVADVFCGGGSVPFAAARLGCNSYGSDLNPIAALLTWASVHIIGAGEREHTDLINLQEIAVANVDAAVTALGIEHDEHGNRAKTYLYCLEARCPRTGWMIPLATTWVVSGKRNVIARLRPDSLNKRFDIDIVTGASSDEVREAMVGTVQGRDAVYAVDGVAYRTPIAALREGNGDGLRLWDKSDFKPRPADVFQERLYCIHWMTKDSLTRSRQVTFFATPTTADMERERAVEKIVADRLVEWQAQGLVPDMQISPGDNTSQPIRERGWTFWHHLFSPRHLLLLSLLRKEVQRDPRLAISFCNTLDFASKLTIWVNSGRDSGGSEFTVHVFTNQALNTLSNYGQGALGRLADAFIKTTKTLRLTGDVTLGIHDARKLEHDADIFVTDPPYADAVNYHEITEFFIAWLRKAPPEPLGQWIWDSRRALAIQGQGEDFRKAMTDTYRVAAEHMPDNGLQIVMFTHQNASVWGDMAQIFWGSGLQVVAAWYIATETTSEMKKGGYVQGTVILVLRKRQRDEGGYKDEIVQEVKVEVASQIETMTGLNQKLRGHGRAENVFEDADLQMAGYAAALRVLTRYTKIDGVDMTKEALRASRTELNMVRDIIDFAAQVANEHMVPEGMPATVWSTLVPSERFYYKMLDIEATGARKLDNYQNFAKAFRVSGYTSLMASLEPNKASLKTAAQFKRALFDETEFALSPTRALLFAIFEIEQEVDGAEVLSHLRDLASGYFGLRDRLIALADYVAHRRSGSNEEESRAARILHDLLRNERLG
jgi:adenine-specific DNA methylase